MKKVILITTISFVFSLTAFGQNPKDKLGLGFSVNQFQNDFGIGLNVISPYFVNSSIAATISVNLQWLQHSNQNTTTWTPYQNIQIGIQGRSFIIDDKIFIYGEGGLITILPNNVFSSKNYVLGGYGAFGFGFKIKPNYGFFIELGGVGTGATADKVKASPIYYNGFLIKVGYAVHLKI